MVLSATPVLAQRPGVDTGLAAGVSVLVQALSAGLATLLVGGGFLFLAEEYTTKTTDRIHEQPGETFVFGIGLGLLTLLVVVVLAITVVGLVLAIPILLAVSVVGVLGYLAVGRLVSDEPPVVLSVAVGVSAFVGGVPVLGGLVGFVLGSMALGAVYLEYRDDGTTDPSGERRPGTNAGTTPGNERPDGPAGDASTGRSGRPPEETAGKPADPDTGPQKRGGDESDAGPTGEPDSPDREDESVSEWGWGLDDDGDTEEGAGTDGSDPADGR
jgi:hypothetical protein